MKSRSRLTIYALSGFVAIAGSIPAQVQAVGKPLDQYGVAASISNAFYAPGEAGSSRPRLIVATGANTGGSGGAIDATGGGASPAVGATGGAQSGAGTMATPSTLAPNSSSSGFAAPGATSTGANAASAAPAAVGSAAPASGVPAAISPMTPVAGAGSAGAGTVAAGVSSNLPATGQGSLLNPSTAPQPPISTGPTITLDQVIARVLAVNPTMQLAQQEVNSAAIAAQETQTQNGVKIDATAVDVLTSYKTTAADGGLSVEQPGVLGTAGIPTLTDQGSSSLFVTGSSVGGLTTGTTTSGTGSTTSTSSSSPTIVPVSPVNPGSSSSSSTSSSSSSTSTTSGSSTDARHTPSDPMIARLASVAGTTQDTTGTGTGTGTGTTTGETFITSTDARYNNYEAGLSATKLLDVFGIVGLAESVNRATEQFYIIDRDRTANELALTIRNTYFDVLKAQDNLVTAREQVANNQAIVNDATVRYNAGAAAQFDVISAQSQLANAQQSLISAQDNLDVERQTLDNLMVVPLDNQYTLTAEPQPPIPATIDTKAEVANADETRPELRQANLDIAIAQKLTKLAGTGLKPTFGIGANIDYTGASPGIDGKYIDGSIVAQVTAPLDDAGLTRAEVRSARNEEKTQQILKDQLTQNIDLEVRSALSNLTAAQALVTADQSGVDLSRESLRIANVRYTAGAGTLLEVTNAEANLAVAEYNLASAEYQLQTAYASYLRAEGRR